MFSKTLKKFSLIAILSTATTNMSDCGFIFGSDVQDRLDPNQILDIVRDRDLIDSIDNINELSNNNQDSVKRSDTNTKDKSKSGGTYYRNSNWYNRGIVLSDRSELWKYTGPDNAQGIDFQNPRSITVDENGRPTHIDGIKVGGWKAIDANNEYISSKPTPGKMTIFTTNQISTKSFYYSVGIELDHKGQVSSCCFDATDKKKYDDSEHIKNLKLNDKESQNSNSQNDKDSPRSKHLTLAIKKEKMIVVK